jgi:hypothetical protein
MLSPRVRRAVVLAHLLLIASCFAAEQPTLQWFKGNLHTHSFWSDGDDFPEMIVDWYKTNGYQFLGLSDHNILQEGTKWVVATNTTRALAALPKYLQRFGSNWVEQGEQKGNPAVRLKTLEEFRKLFEDDRFLLMKSEEVSDRFSRWPLHFINSNLRELIKPPGGTSIVDVVQRNFDVVTEQRKKTGAPILHHLAHPNFGWALTAEDIIQVRSERFFEVYNGHNDVNNEGDKFHVNTERMWDIINTHRIGERNDPPLLGLAVDDAHHYHKFSPKNANAGRGWVVVRAAELKPEAIITALEAGDFYASSGVRLGDVIWKDNKLTVRIEPEAGVTYTTQFIGTRAPVDWTSKPVTGARNHSLGVTRRYSSGIGAVLSVQIGGTATYTCKGDELYVRACVISSKPKKNAVAKGDWEKAWTQPVQPKK